MLEDSNNGKYVKIMIKIEETHRLSNFFETIFEGIKILFGI